MSGPSEGSLPPGRFAYYREEIDDLFLLARTLFSNLKQHGKSECEIEWFLQEYPDLFGESGQRYDPDHVLASGICLGILEPVSGREDAFLIR